MSSTLSKSLISDCVKKSGGMAWHHFHGLRQPPEKSHFAIIHKESLVNTRVAISIQKTEATIATGFKNESLNLTTV